MTQIRNLIARLEKTKVAEQLFRVARIVVVGAVTGAVTGSPVTVVGVVAAAEAAFRQVFPVQAAKVDAVVAAVEPPKAA